jgi:hypothetical protein
MQQWAGDRRLYDHFILSDLDLEATERLAVTGKTHPYRKGVLPARMRLAQGETFQGNGKRPTLQQQSLRCIDGNLHKCIDVRQCPQSCKAEVLREAIPGKVELAQSCTAFQDPRSLQFLYLSHPSQEIAEGIVLFQDPVRRILVLARCGTQHLVNRRHDGPQNGGCCAAARRSSIVLGSASFFRPGTGIAHPSVGWASRM